MSDFITLSCPSCGGRLEITKDMDRFVCAHCGNEQIVRRAGGTISLAPVMEGLQKVQASTDRVGAELAIQRLTREITDAEYKIKDANEKLAAAKKLAASHPSGMLAGALAIFSFLATAACGFFTFAAMSVKTEVGFFVTLTIIGLIITALLGGLAWWRSQQGTPLKRAANDAQLRLDAAQNEWNSLIRQRDAARSKAGL